MSRRTPSPPLMASPAFRRRMRGVQARAKAFAEWEKLAATREKERAAFAALPLTVAEGAASDGVLTPSWRVMDFLKRIASRGFRARARS